MFAVNENFSLNFVWFVNFHISDIAVSVCFNAIPLYPYIALGDCALAGIVNGKKRAAVQVFIVVASEACFYRVGKADVFVEYGKVIDMVVTRYYVFGAVKFKNGIEKADIYRRGCDLFVFASGADFGVKAAIRPVGICHIIFHKGDMKNYGGFHRITVVFILQSVYHPFVPLKLSDIHYAVFFLTDYFAVHGVRKDELFVISLIASYIGAAIHHDERMNGFAVPGNIYNIISHSAYVVESALEKAMLCFLKTLSQPKQVCVAARIVVAENRRHGIPKLSIIFINFLWHWRVCIPQSTSPDMVMSFGFFSLISLFIVLWIAPFFLQSKVWSV